MAKPVKGTSQINVELPPEVLDQLKRFAEERGQTLKYVVWRAVVRHMDNPPPIVPDPPLPDALPEVVKSAPKKPARKKK